jgi:hypothetical protein
MKLRSERSEIIATGGTCGKVGERANPKGVEYETTFRAERDNSLKKTWGKRHTPLNPKRVETTFRAERDNMKLRSERSEIIALRKPGENVTHRSTPKGLKLRSERSEII